MHTGKYRIPSHTIYEHWLDVPLDYFGALERLPEGTSTAGIGMSITIFAREYVRDGQENAPRLVFFQGGPGNAAPRMAPLGSWLDTALNYFRVVLLDERGTGNSNPLEASAITSVGSPEVQAAYLSCFRQDSIVQDAERMRQALQGDTKWAALGQSFGGFCVTCYLSQAPEGLSEAFITAGLPSTHLHPDEVYRRTYAQTAVRNRQLFERYPGDEETAWYIAEHLADVEEYLPTGERLTPGRFRQLGMVLGYSYGLESLHFLLEDPIWNFHGQRRIRPQTLAKFGHALSFADDPLYAVLHESIYGQESVGALGWSAQRVRGEFPEFDLPARAAGASGEMDLRTLGEERGFSFRFTGEHIFPWQFDEDPALRGLKPAAENLEFSTHLPNLYDRDVLAENTVPTAAWIYVDDMFVPFDLSRQTASEIRGLRPLISNKYHHDALRTAGPGIVEDLVAAVRQ
ncbi:MAG: alpha/beta fold hydrolase [Actinomycetaceae bacterium]|nr:alpha/beta fold hydrolase [Actinomycetaceae bacterium]MDY6082459.1 alpha/beta fold hydrolase [Actinomycetaceae bacterium]